ncbi:MAG: tyrosine-protein phosphatase [Blautia sp.]|nr:tyrosine-protein phosphatase [Blautia sp.]
MKFGKLQIEDGTIHFSSHIVSNSIPCQDVIWAYHRRASSASDSMDRQLVTNVLVLVTKRGRRYEFAMSEDEASECLMMLKRLIPGIATGFPRGSRILMQNLTNTRDLGAIETKQRKYILPGRLLRSSELYHISARDHYVLESEYQVKTVIDLRSRSERNKRPDDPVIGARYVSIPLLEEGSSSIFLDTGMADQISQIDKNPQEEIREEYIRLIQDPYVIGQLALVLETIRKSEKGAVLWHCTLGKDRTDFVTGILLYILGVSREDIREEYMRSNIYLGIEKNYMIQLLEEKGFERHILENRVRCLYEVRLSYIDALFKTLEKDYGSVEHFLRTGLYLTPKAIEDLRNKYLI